METRFTPWSRSLGLVAGYILAWAAMTLALTLASRSLQLGPGFSNPLPYAGIALAMNQSGRLLKKWLAS